MENNKKEKQKQEEKETSNWQKLVNGIVRPPRAKYNQMQLGAKVFNYKDRYYMREDYKVQHLEKSLDLTVYNASGQHNYLILYMHGNSSCRLEAVTLVRYLPDGVSLGSFDFMGCGKNEEVETISLGYRQADQAKTVVQFLKNLKYKVILWGRSMGAATSLLYGQAEFIVADSSYKSFKSLCKQVAKDNTPVPNFMINCFFPCVFSKLRDDVDKKANYDVQDLDVKQAVKRLDPNTTVVFMSGDKDKLIVPRNSTKLYNLCPCQNKYLKIFQGDHNSKRPQQVMNQVMGLIKQHIEKKQRNSIATQHIILQFESQQQ